MRSNPPGCLLKIWLIWSEFPHSSFSATSSAYDNWFIMEGVRKSCWLVFSNLFLSHQHDNYGRQVKNNAARYFSSESECGRMWEVKTMTKAMETLKTCDKFILTFRTSLLWSVSQTSRQNLLQSIPVIPVLYSSPYTHTHARARTIDTFSWDQTKAN